MEGLRSWRMIDEVVSGVLSCILYFDILTTLSRLCRNILCN